jgi:hypothetical protein
MVKNEREIIRAFTELTESVFEVTPKGICDSIEKGSLDSFCKNVQNNCVKNIIKIMKMLEAENE